MTYRFMRIIDESLGVLLCRIAGVILQLSRLLLPAPQPKEAAKIKRILIQKYFGLGSILHAIQLIKILRNNYPNARITFITIGSNTEIIQLCNLADDLLVIDFGSPVAFVKSCSRLVLKLPFGKFDISIDLEFFAKFPLLVSALSRAPVKIGLFHRKARPNGILTHKVTFNAYRHISEIYLAYAEVLYLKPAMVRLDQCLPSFRTECEYSIRKRYQLEHNRGIIIVNVNSGDLFSFRKWPAQHFVTLLSLLLERHPNYTYMLIGSQSERGYIEEIISKVIGATNILINCAGQTSIKELFTLIEMSELIITNDSGPLHIGSLYGKNLAAFFGPETPVLYGPLNSNVLVFYPDKLYCSPCLCVYDSKQSLYAETCEENICLSALQPHQVITALEERFLAYTPSSN